ncbi:hypothetical protein ACJJTC_006266 [Scirpophaga incertulas]
MALNSESSQVPHLFNDNTEKVWKALRIVPEFDGNPKNPKMELIRFLDICDQLVINFLNPAHGNELNNSALLNGILNKITGNAAKTLATNGIPTDWQRWRIRCMRPESLEKALEFAQEELNVLYLRNKKINSNPRYVSSHLNMPQQVVKPFQFPNFNQNSIPHVNRFQPPINNAPYYFRFPNTPQFNNRPQGQGLSRTQQMMRALPRDNFSTGFRIEPRPRQMNHQPMSRISHPMARTLPSTSQNRAQQNIHVHETTDPLYSYHNSDTYYDEYSYLNDYTDDTTDLYSSSSSDNPNNSEQEQQENFFNKPLKNSPE